MASRQPNRRPKIYPGKRRNAKGEWERTGKYHCYVTLGYKPDGTLDRKHIERWTQAGVVEAIEDLQRRAKLASGGTVSAKVQTVEDWVTHWIENVVKPSKKYKTYQAYRPIIYKHVIPRIGHWRLDGTRKPLEPEHVEAMYAQLKRSKTKGGAGLSASYVRQVHAVLRVALKAAVRRGKAGRNVCDMIDPPAFRAKKVEGFELAPAQAILREAFTAPMAARWLVGLLLGPRQGEVLGLRWPRVRLDADVPYLRIEQQLQRHTWEHGCMDPVGCAAPHCKTKACGPAWEHGCPDPAGCKGNPRWCPARASRSCRRHKRPESCQPCPPRCTDHARLCPERADGGLVEVEVKSEKGQRDIPLPPPIVEALERWRQEQMRQYQERGEQWDDKGLVFTSALGKPIDPRRDHEAWEQLLVRAGVPDKALHAARHTAASMLIATGTEITVLQELFGHSDVRTSRGYVDVAAKLKEQAVARIAEALLDGDLAVLLQRSPATKQARD